MKSNEVGPKANNEGKNGRNVYVRWGSAATGGGWINELMDMLLRATEVRGERKFSTY